MKMKTNNITCHSSKPNQQRWHQDRIRTAALLNHHFQICPSDKIICLALLICDLRLSITLEHTRVFTRPARKIMNLWLVSQHTACFTNVLFNKQYYLCSLNQNNKVRKTKIHDCVFNYTDSSKKKLKQGKNILLWSNFANFVLQPASCKSCTWAKKESVPSPG